MAQTPRSLVYIASNHKGLEAERYEVARQLAKMGLLICGFPCREDTGPYDWELAKCQIEDANLFIMILGDDYGPMAPTGISYLHRELVYAQSLSKPVLSFVKNSQLSKNKTEEQIRLAGFHTVVSKGTFRLWHLREELTAHVKTSVTNALSHQTGGWLKTSSKEDAAVHYGKIMEKPLGLKSSEAVSVDNSKSDNKEWALHARKLFPLQMTANVYVAGNNTLEEISISQRLDVLFACAGELMKTSSSEDRLRKGFEKLMVSEVKRRLHEQHPSAHAIDDVKISRSQVQQLLHLWFKLELIKTVDQPGRKTWQLTSKGMKRIIALRLAKPAIQ